MVFWGNVCIDVVCLQLRPEDPQSCGFGCNPAGHHQRLAHPTALRPRRHSSWLWSSTARSALQTISSSACPSEFALWNRPCNCHPKPGHDLRSWSGQLCRPGELGSVWQARCSCSPTESTAGVWFNTYSCTGSGSADNLTSATSLASVDPFAVTNEIGCSAVWRGCGNGWKTSNISKSFGTANKPALFACDVTRVFVPTTNTTTWCNIGIRKLHSFLELSRSHLRFLLFYLGQDWNVIGCSVHVCELSWTMFDGNLTTYCLHLNHLWDLSEPNTLHADTWSSWARGCPRLFLCNACKLGVRIDQAWSSIGFLSLLFPHIFVWGSCFWFCIPCSSSASSRPLLSTHTLSTHTFSTNTVSTHTLSTHTLSIHTLSTHTLSTYILSTHTLSTHTLSTHTLQHTLCPHTLCPHTPCQHTLCPHTLCPHTITSHTQTSHTQTSHTIISHTQT